MPLAFESCRCRLHNTRGLRGSAGILELRDGPRPAPARDDFSTCATTAEIQVPLKNCESVGEADEYGALCGGVGPGLTTERPTGCRGHNFANPGGLVIYCALAGDCAYGAIVATEIFAS